MRIGVLTGGGDCPGLNAVIRGVVARAERLGHQSVGILHGWDGLLENKTRELGRDDVRGILQRGGTILGTSRRDPYAHANGWESVRSTLETNRLNALVVIGGDGTLRSALKLSVEGDFPIVGVPKTIDNDIAATDRTFGFDTAVQIATDAIDRLSTTAESHDRIMVVEVMGRTKGWIALYAGLASGADEILIPEVPYDLDRISREIERRHADGHTYSMIVVAEGIEPPPGSSIELPLDAFGFPRLGGVGYTIASELERRTGFEARVNVLGYLQRGGTPTATDRILATRFGIAAADAIHDGHYGTMVALRGNDIKLVSLDEATAEVRGVPRALYDDAGTFFG
ncbi:MAG: ATP-dependent 6-phosphofructokinase [Actinobacteria bacterium]|uniref:6-phosphofructokinase n=1 Tax=freshwater metagenome TaxID=449393 RepID=A0A6J6P8J6_9ZZZZ|nr:ATP-dependent 6-phosphofructokinase [Actinomycetota bacterium]